jgi:hypothetical protein
MTSIVGNDSLDLESVGALAGLGQLEVHERYAIFVQECFADSTRILVAGAENTIVQAASAQSGIVRSDSDLDADLLPRRVGRERCNLDKESAIRCGIDAGPLGQRACHHRLIAVKLREPLERQDALQHCQDTLCQKGRRWRRAQRLIPGGDPLSRPLEGSLSARITPGQVALHSSAFLRREGAS